MNRFVAPVLLSLILAGCVTVHESYAPDGRRAYTLNCTAKYWDDCLSRAGEICGSAGYDVFQRSDGMPEKSMLIACKGPK